jgi:molybdopterin-containing oxidoreductase family iron-sulfur binding subunit
MRFGMIIDLDKCTACQACVVACKTENNVPSSNSKDASEARSITWMKMMPIEEGEFPYVKMQLQPVPCMQCDHPPCIKVCPVGATYKSEETGIVGQIYNRCIGCRYCTNACPYTVRYFNWYEPVWDSESKNYLNPDVFVRPKGVVEKCTFCHHRLQKAQEKARAEKRKLTNADYIPACVEVCPASAMYFGDLDDPTSDVAKLSRSTRAFKLLEDLGTEPKVIYLK